MKNSKRLSLFILALSIAGKAFSQGEIPVDMYTGTASIMVPLCPISGHELGENVGLTYAARGIKLDQPSGRFGIGWNLEAGGYVAREVRGLPDDYVGVSGDNRKGWFYVRASTNKTMADDVVTSFGNTSDLSAATCPEEVADFQHLSSYSGTLDTQPDLFSFSVGGYSGKFVFDNSTTPQIRLIPYQDISIVPTFLSGSNKRITKFTITTNTGTVYTLETADNETREALKLTLEPTVEFFRTEFDLYKPNGAALTSYNTKWNLTKASSPNGDELNYMYDFEQVTLTDTIRAAIKKNPFSANPLQIAGDQTYAVDSLYADRRITTQYRLIAIGASKVGLQLDFNYGPNGLLQNVSLYDTRLSSNQASPVLVKQYDLAYSPGTEKRVFLLSVTESSGTTSMPPYRFNYYFNAIPTRYTKAKDFWGYYNGQDNKHLAPQLFIYPDLPPAERYRLYGIPGYSGTEYISSGANRAVNPNTVAIASLRNVYYPSGGSTTLEYEPNEFYDSIANQNFYGGGIRIKSIVYEDGLNTTNKIEKHFVYKNGSNVSTGRIIQRPSFAIPVHEYRNPASSEVISYSAGTSMPTFWDLFTVKSEGDLTGSENRNEDIVGYKEVKVYRTGSGYAHYEFKMPATFGFETYGEWDATKNKFARSACEALGVINQGSSFAFPYVINPNFDHQRGLVWRKREYDENNVLVRETKTNYQNIFKSGTASYKVYGLDYSRYPNQASNGIFLFGKYFLLTDMARVVASEQVINYDASANTLAQKSEFFYESTSHKLLTRTKQTTGDGTVFQTRVKYPLDYGTIPGGADEASQMIGQLQASLRNGVAVEVYQTMKRPGQLTKVVGGAIVKFSDFDTTLVRPQYELQFNTATSIDTASFVKSYVHTNGQFKTDPAYEVANTFLSYDKYGKARTTRGMDSVKVTNVWAYKTSVPIATITNAEIGQFAFSDFEITTPVSFALEHWDEVGDGGPSPVLYGAGRTGSVSVQHSTRMTATLTKAESTYRVSGWWNKYTTLLTVHVDITSSGGNSNQTFTLSAPSSADPNSDTFEYFEKLITLPAGATLFDVEIYFTSQGGGPITGGPPTPLVDDVAFYPASSLLTSYTYQFPFGVNSSTSLGDKTGYKVFDALGRVRYVLDRNKNILQRNNYKFQTN